MAGESLNDPLDLSDDSVDLAQETSATSSKANGNGMTAASSTAATVKGSASTSRSPPQTSTISSTLHLPSGGATNGKPIEVTDTPPRAQQQQPASSRVLPPGFGQPRQNSSKPRQSTNGSSTLARDNGSSAGPSNAAKSHNGRVWNPPPRPGEAEARARAAQAVATLRQPDSQVPTISGATARVPSSLVGSHPQGRMSANAIDLTNDDGSDDDEPTVVSFKKGDIELDEEKNNGPVCIGVVPAIVLCMYGVPEPIASDSPAVHDPSQDRDPRWDRNHWPGASRWFAQPGYRPVVVKVKYPAGFQSSMAQQRTVGEWSYGGNRPPPQRGKPEMAVSVVLSPRAHIEKQLQEGVPQQNLSKTPYYKPPFGTLADKFVDALEPLIAQSTVHCEARCRMVPRGRAGGFLHSVELLLFCLRPKVSLVADQLSRYGIVLEPPRQEQFDSADYNGNPPLVHPHGLGSSAQARELANRSRFASSLYTPGLGGGRMVQSKEMTEEERKKQIEQVYDQLVSGDDLPQAEPSELIKTNLFPHQRQAVSFLLGREQERSFDDAQDTAKSNSKSDVKSAENAVSLWKVIRSRVDGSIRTFHNVVTQHQQTEEPEICRGAILADDMGLGKTITVIATIAATIADSKQFQRGKIDRGRGKQSAPQAEEDDDDVDESAGDLAFGLQGSSSKRPKKSSGSTAKKSASSKGKQKQKDIESVRRENLVTRSRATLIVCPLSIVSNWEEQIKEHWDSKSQPKIYIYHGPSRSSSPQVVAANDIVMTTYATLAAEFANQHTWTAGEGEEEDSDDEEFDVVDANGDSLSKPKRGKKRKRHTGKEAANTLQRIEWFRIVLDEAHTIKEARTMQCKAVCNLSAQRRLSLTGTPVQNRLDDLFAQVRFLRLYPFTERSVWNEHCAQRRSKNSITSRTNASQNNEPLEQMALVKVQTIMKFLTLRRTKYTKTPEGRPLLELPPKVTHQTHLQFDEKEQAAYKALHQKYKEDFEEMQAAGSVGANYATILQEILLLRMSCDHTELVDASKDMKRLREGNADIGKAIEEDGLTRQRAAKLFELFSESAMAECASCGTDLSRLAEDSGGGAGRLDEGEDTVQVRPVVTRCQHIICSTCFGKAAGAKWLKPKSIKAEDKVFCPACNEELGLLLDVIKLDGSDVSANRSAQQSPSRELEAGGDDDDFDWGSDDEKDGTTKNGKNGSSRKGGFGVDRNVAVEERPGLSSKIRFLLSDLIPFSKCNPKSALYDVEAKQLQHHALTPEEKAEHGMTEDVAIVQSNDNPRNYRPIKSVVFSQWTTMLDQVATALHRSGIRYVRLDGKMKRQERANALDSFKMDDGVEIFLISLRAGGFGLNLVNACRAYNIEPAWNPAVEAQAMDRIHRMGQTRPVMVKKLIMKNTIEERMLDVQKRKQELANQVGEKRTTQSKADERAQRHQELSMLLSGDGSVGGASASGTGGRMH